MIDKLMEVVENLLLSTQNGFETLLAPLNDNVITKIFGANINPLMLLSFTTLEILFVYYLIRGLVI